MPLIKLGSIKTLNMLEKTGITNKMKGDRFYHAFDQAFNLEPIEVRTQADTVRANPGFDVSLLREGEQRNSITNPKGDGQ